jgi:hypothetical protein
MFGPARPVNSGVTPLGVESARPIIARLWNESDFEITPDRHGVTLERCE